MMVKKMTKKMIAWLLIAFFSVLAIPVISGNTVSYAAGEYYGTWKEYKDSLGADANVTWTQVAGQMGVVLDKAIENFEAGKYEEAYNNINQNGYYGWYETTGFERNVQAKISGARVSQVELQFSTTRTVARNQGTLDEFKSKVEELRTMLNEDAAKLDGVSGTATTTERTKYDYYTSWKEFSEKESPKDEANGWTWNEIADAMTVVLDKAIENFEAGDFDAAYKNINNEGYYGWYETTGFERNVQARISGARVSEVELQFSTTRTVARDGKEGKATLDEFKEKVEELRAMLDADADTLDGVTVDSGATQSSGGTSAAVATFLGCFAIILREGLEAILVVGAIIAYLMKTGNTEQEKKRQVRPVYIGSILGIVASFIAAWLLSLLKLAGSANQEIIEGVTALIAVVVLYWVSNWMVSKSESEAWSAYIKSKVKSSSEKGSMFALAFTAFLAVFREGAEVILFYQPMLAEDHPSMVWLGFGVGCVCLVFVFIAIRVLSLRLPLKPFFLGTSIFMFIMSISFLGSGIKELIEGGWFSATSSPVVSWIPYNDVLGVLGVYPIDQTIFPQLLLLVVTIVVFILQLRRNKRIREEVQKEAAE